MAFDEREPTYAPPAPSRDGIPETVQDPHAPRRTATVRSTSSQHRSMGRARSQHSHSGSNATMISFEEYEALPTSIRKKYFSSTERLHIAQQSAIQKRRKLSLGQASWKSSSTNTDIDLRPATSQGIGLRRRPSRRQPKDTNTALAEFDVDNISEEQARWFLTLPDKIRKQHFSRKEQIALAVRCKRALQSTSPDLAQDALRRCLNIGREEETAYVSKQRRRSSATVDTDILIDDDFADGDSESASVHSVETLATEMEIFNLYSRPHASESRDRVSIPPPPKEPPMQQPKSTPEDSKEWARKSFSRSFALAPVPLPPPQLSPVPPVPPLPQTDQVRHFALSSRFARPQYAGPTSPSQEPTEAKHYQETDVRKQIRHYLSPQKFDEALEFGFALSNEEEEAPSSSATDRSFPLQPPPSYHTEDDFGDEDSNESVETLSPRTPTTTSDVPHPAVKQPSFDSSIEIPIRQGLFTTTKNPKTHTPSGSFGNREMTIHMTLTRRDLRSPGEDLFSFQPRPQTSGVDIERIDPLALESLPVCDDPTGAHGVFAVRDSKSNGFKRVWKSLKRR